MTPRPTTGRSGGCYSLYTVKEPEIQRVHSAGILARNRQLGMTPRFVSVQSLCLIVTCILKDHPQHKKDGPLEMHRKYVTLGFGLNHNLTLTLPDES